MAELKVKIEPEDIVDRVLDETYKGRTLREWADALTQPKTQADRVRAMSDEELAKWLTISVIPRVCEIPLKAGNEPMLDKWLDWLRSEAKEEDNGREDI